MNRRKFLAFVSIFFAIVTMVLVIYGFVGSPKGLIVTPWLSLSMFLMVLAGGLNGCLDKKKYCWARLAAALMIAITALRVISRG